MGTEKIDPSAAYPASNRSLIFPVPVAWSDFSAKPLFEQKRLVVEASREPLKDPAVLRFLLESVIVSSAYQPVVRNVAADTVIEARFETDRVVSVLTAAIDAPDENPRWRDYALQHLTRLADLNPTRIGPVVEILQRVAQAGGDRSDTALLLWHRLRSGHPELDRRALDACIAETFANPERNGNATAVALGIVAECKDDSQRHQVLRHLRHPLPHVRRAALGALGAIGTSADQALMVERQEQDPDALVRLVAAQAVVSLTARVKTDSSNASEPSSAPAL